MTTQDLNQKIKEETTNENFVELREYLDENFSKVWKTHNGQFTNNIAAANYDANGSCTNVYLVTSDGHVEFPF